MFKADTVKSSASKSSKAGGREHDGSSAESGDSEIELVSEPEPPKASSNPFGQPPKSKPAFSQPSNPFDNPPLTAKGGFGSAGNHAAPTAYSILREEREAELDSDLFIESASEESPKREQGLAGPKQPVSPPSPLLSTSSAPAARSPAQAAAPAEPPAPEKVKTPAKAEEERPVKPKPPTAAVPPEVRPEKSQQDDAHKHEGKGDLGKPSTSVFLGFDKQKGQFTQFIYSWLHRMCLAEGK